MFKKFDINTITETTAYKTYNKWAQAMVIGCVGGLAKKGASKLGLGRVGQTVAVIGAEAAYCGLLVKCEQIAEEASAKSDALLDEASKSCIERLKEKYENETFSDPPSKEDWELLKEAAAVTAAEALTRLPKEEVSNI